MVNVVNLMKLQPASEHPHGLSDADFDALFAKDSRSSSPSTATPGSSTISLRKTEQNLHVRGYKEEGTTTTPFDMVVLNDPDGFRLVEGVIDRLPQLGIERLFKQAIHEKLIEHKEYIERHGDDVAISGWRWGLKGAASKGSTTTEGDNV